MSKKSQSQDAKRIDNISASRYIPHVFNGAGTAMSVPIEAKFVGNKGVLVQANCLDMLANMKDGCVDLVFLDPPFNLRKNYNVRDFSDTLHEELYKGWCRTWLVECTRVLKPGGALFLYHLPKALMELGTWLSSVDTLKYKCWIALKMKSGFPIKGRIHPAHYGLLYFVKKGSQPTFNVVRQRSPRCRNRKCRELVRDYGGYRAKYKQFEVDGDVWIQISDFWEDTRPASHDKVRRTQINELPMQIPERAILMASNPGDLVLDCFSGGGSTLHAAQLHNRSWIAIDIENSDASLRRLKTFFDVQEVRTPPGRIRRCFDKNFVQRFLTIHPNSRQRPIRRVRRLAHAMGDKFKSKSRIFPASATMNGAPPDRYD